MDILTIIGRRSKRAKLLQKAGVSLALANLGVEKVIGQDPNTVYDLGIYQSPFQMQFQPLGSDYVLTDGEAQYRVVGGRLTVTIINARWVARPTGAHVVLFTEMDNMHAATAIRGWFRKKGRSIKRLGFPAYNLP